ncbi:16S rRNA methyltransferase [Mammaliicoccus sciuri]|uniref:16S rRNA (uracil(1498)-N(3))-methyltransferase n=1 Tax=Mammaliicoccus TaxID=2803850 RepID=UPI00065B8D2F|nr:MULTISPECIES: 16S rRNA (uracil(1498)-N(3))-methyltransferase [Mammaliicoccus]HCW36756.1 16S rRNA (uracil(1498)-N(3))-methyltransferase [Staphylococcus sp.]KTT86243.1 16S rRNA methyltransferase [Mammaliicoccus sciuri]KTT88129.1 16S rRNA methyltransferase [Mammaliicoccus sciuri]KTT91303.1 16S rRNA methyltransferase [Mammaliicoccus sciuri]KTT92866.1 16S rRNA methyltransferase [Mammaliicoccus sciuri]
MQRYFLQENAELNQRFFIHNTDDIHHIKNVMRKSVDQEIILTFEDQKSLISKIIAFHDDSIELETVEDITRQTELPVDITIASGLIKGDKYEWLLQKATEMGAHHFIAVQSERSIVKLDEKKISKKLDRWQKIVKEASEQSMRLTIPSIKYKSNFKSIYDNMNEYDYVIIAYEEEAKSGGTSKFHQIGSNLKHGQKVLMIFGPEGGLTENEVNLYDDAIKVSLGPRILRAETAPLYALAALSYQLELMR